jgi:hypothetical protein
MAIYLNNVAGWLKRPAALPERRRNGSAYGEAVR